MGSPADKHNITASDLDNAGLPRSHQRHISPSLTPPITPYSRASLGHCIVHSPATIRVSLSIPPPTTPSIHASNAVQLSGGCVRTVVAPASILGRSMPGRSCRGLATAHTSSSGGTSPAVAEQRRRHCRTEERLRRRTAERRHYRTEERRSFPGCSPRQRNGVANPMDDASPQRSCGPAWRAPLSPAACMDRTTSTPLSAGMKSALASLPFICLKGCEPPTTRSASAGCEVPHSDPDARRTASLNSLRRRNASVAQRSCFRLPDFPQHYADLRPHHVKRVDSTRKSTTRTRGQTMKGA